MAGGAERGTARKRARMEGGGALLAADTTIEMDAVPVGTPSPDASHMDVHEEVEERVKRSTTLLRAKGDVVSLLESHELPLDFGMSAASMDTTWRARAFAAASSLRTSLVTSINSGIVPWNMNARRAPAIGERVNLAPTTVVIKAPLAAYVGLFAPLRRDGNDVLHKVALDGIFRTSLSAYGWFVVHVRRVEMAAYIRSPVAEKAAIISTFNDLSDAEVAELDAAAVTATLTAARNTIKRLDGGGVCVRLPIPVDTAALSSLAMLQAARMLPASGADAVVLNRKQKAAVKAFDSTRPLLRLPRVIALPRTTAAEKRAAKEEDTTLASLQEDMEFSLQSVLHDAAGVQDAGSFADVRRALTGIHLRQRVGSFITPGGSFTLLAELAPASLSLAFEPLPLPRGATLSDDPLAVMGLVTLKCQYACRSVKTSALDAEDAEIDAVKAWASDTGAATAAATAAAESKKSAAALKKVTAQSRKTAGPTAPAPALPTPASSSRGSRAVALATAAHAAETAAVASSGVKRRREEEKDDASGEDEARGADLLTQPVAPCAAGGRSPAPRATPARVMFQDDDSDGDCAPTQPLFMAAPASELPAVLSLGATPKSPTTVPTCSLLRLTSPSLQR